MQATPFDLAKVLAPIEPETFFQNSWEKQPLAVSRNDPTYYSGLFTRHDLDSVIAFTRPRIMETERFKPGEPARLNYMHGWLSGDEPNSGYYPGLPDLHRAFAAGKTLIIESMHHRWPAVATLCRHLEAVLGSPVQANLYITPPKAQGFDAHFDTHDVFVLQIDGDKHWQLYGVGRELPLVNDRAITPRKDQLGPPRQEVHLQPGDMLYLPRGHIHEAFTSERTSMHLTVGVRVYRWLDVLIQALLDAAAGDVRFRQALPPGLLCTNSAAPGLQEKFNELVQLFASRASMPNAVGALAASFVSNLTALPHDYFAIDEPDRIDLDTILEKTPGLICRVVQKGDHVTLLAPDGGGIEGPGKIAPALHFIAQTQRFTSRNLPDNLAADAKLVLVRRLLREKLLTIVNPSTNAG